MRRQRGMSIVVALVVVVVVASLAAFAVTVGGAQRQAQTTNLEASRAVAAARTGLAWGVYRARAGWCDMAVPVKKTQLLSLTEGALNGFRVSISCTGYRHTEPTGSYYTYDIEATSSHGTYGSTDFASRTVSARHYSPGF